LLLPHQNQCNQTSPRLLTYNLLAKSNRPPPPLPVLITQYPSPSPVTSSRPTSLATGSVPIPTHALSIIPALRSPPREPRPPSSLPITRSRSPYLSPAAHCMRRLRPASPASCTPRRGARRPVSRALPVRTGARSCFASGAGPSGPVAPARRPHRSRSRRPFSGTRPRPTAEVLAAARYQYKVPASV